jgi:hypothetical protein
MKLSYDVFIRHEVYRALQGASAHDQERISDFIESLAGNPFRKGMQPSQMSTGALFGQIAR